MALAPSAGTTQELDADQIAALKRLYANKDKLDKESRVIVESLGPQYGITDSGETAGEAAQRSIFQMGKQAALPIAGQIAGGAIEGALTRGADTIAGQSAGAMLGVKANEMLGITKPTPEDYFLAGMAPPVARAATAAGRALIPGKEAALQQMAVPRMEAVAGKVAKGGVDAAYKALEPFADLPIPAGHLNETFARLGKVESVAKQFGLGSAPINRLVTKGEQAMATEGGRIKFGDAMIVLKRLREKISGMEEKGGEAWGAYKAARKALFDDLDEVAKAGGTQGTAVVKYAAAREAAKKAIAQNELADVLAKDGTRIVTVGGQTFPIIEPTKVLNKLKKMEFAQSVDKATWAGIEKELKQLARVPRPAGTERVALGTPGRVIATGGTGLAATAGFMSAGPMGAAMGTAAAAGAVGAHEAIARLMMSDKGRNLLVKVFTANEGRMGERTAAMLEFVAAQLQTPAED